MDFWFEGGVWYAKGERRTYQFTDAEAQRFVAANARNECLGSRVSPLLALQMLVWFREEGEPIRAFARPMIDVLEGTRASWEKPHAPLKGAKLKNLHLFHKHVSLARHMVMNAALAVNVPQVLDAAIASMREALADDGDLDKAAEAGATPLIWSVQRRMEEARQTGDWIVFEEEGGEPYFLCHFSHPVEGEDSDGELERLVAFVRSHWRRPAQES